MATDDDLIQLLDAYMGAALLVDALPRVMRLPYSRTFLGRRIRVARIRWRRLIRYFVIDHAHRSAGRLVQMYAARAARAEDPKAHSDEFVRLEAFRRSLPVVPIRRLAVASVLLVAILSYAAIPALLDDRAERLFAQVVGSVPVMDPTQVVSRLDLIGKAVKEAGQGEVREIGSDAGARGVSQSSSEASDAQRAAERFDPQDAAVIARVLVVLWVMLYAVLFLPTHGFRIKRLLFNLYPVDRAIGDSPAEHARTFRPVLIDALRDSAAVEQPMLAQGIYEKEGALCAKLGSGPFRELPIDLLTQVTILGLLAPFVLVVVPYSTGFKALLRWPSSALTATAFLSMLYLSTALPKSVLDHRKTGRPSGRSIVLEGAAGVVALVGSFVALGAALPTPIFGFGLPLSILAAGIAIAVLPFIRLTWVLRVWRRRRRREAVPAAETQGETQGWTTVVKESLQAGVLLCLVGGLGLWIASVTASTWWQIVGCSQQPMHVEKGAMRGLLQSRAVLEAAGMEPSAPGSFVPPIEAFIRQPCGKTLYAIRADGELTRIPQNGILADPVWSPKGDRIAVLAEEGRNTKADLWVMQADGSQATRIKTDVGAEPPRWSPDGRWLAFVSRGQLWTAAAGDPSTARSVWSQVGSLSYVSDIHWSPDGRRIAFNGPQLRPEGPPGPNQVYSLSSRIVVINADGTGSLEVADGFASQWSPDGATILVSRDLDSSLFLVAPNGTGMRRIGEGAGLWSPDRRRILLNGRPAGDSAPDAGTYGVFLLAADGTSPVLLGELPGAVSWSPDGAALLISAYDGDVWWAKEDGTGLRKIATSFDRADWSSDGQWVLLGRDVSRTFGRHLWRLYATKVAEAAPLSLLARIDEPDPHSYASRYAPGIVPAPRDPGYRLVSAQGAVRCAGVRFCGMPADTPIQKTVVGMAAQPSGAGYGLAASDGTVLSFGAARYKGSAPEVHAPIVGIASTSSGEGYWLAASDGQVYPFGDAKALPAPPVEGSQRVIGIVAAPSAEGYWLLTQDGDVLPTGAARFYGSSRGQGVPVVAMAPTPSGQGYWLVGSDGSVVPFGEARLYPAHGSRGLDAPVSAMLPTLSGRGYWLAAADGRVVAFGDASDVVPPTVPPGAAIVGIG